MWQSPSHAAVAAARLRCPNAHVTIPRLNMSIICMLRLHRCVLAAERSTPAVRACRRAQLVCRGVVRDGCAVPRKQSRRVRALTLSTLCTTNSTPQRRLVECADSPRLRLSAPRVPLKLVAIMLVAFAARVRSVASRLAVLTRLPVDSEYSAERRHVCALRDRPGASLPSLPSLPCAS